MSVPVRIPQPRPRPLVGNAPDVGMETPVQNMMKLAREYGPVFRLKFPTMETVVVSSHQLVNELCDAQRFDKHVHGPLQHIRALAGDGLFTADTSMPNWGRAHRILMPAFGPQAVKNYFDGMYDIAEQLISKWARLGDRVELDVPDNMTRLTLDTIALCGFGYRFNSFYQREMHPFVDAMVRSLSEASARSRRLPLQTKVNLLGRLQFGTDLHFMNSVVDELIRERRSEGATDHADLLSLMLAGRDPQTGEGLDDLNIRYQMVTFLIAGHETTSGLLSFALYELMRHPELLARARGEVDAVLGGDTARFEHLAKLTFIDQVLRETLRLWPTAPAFAMTPKTRTTFAGTEVNPGDSLLVLVPMLHRDPTVWSGDVERFDPERFAPGKIEAIPPNAWKPFGTGERACIGRPFAMQEATLVLAMLLQRFDLIPSDNYQLTVKETLTLKPDGLTMRVRERTNRPRKSPVPLTPVATPPSPTSSAAAPHGTPMLVLFGSNSGSSEAFARRVANDARNRGYAVKLSSMNEASGKLPASGALVVVTASYNGQPPDNARAFCDWLDTVPAGTLSGLDFVVFGCGNRDWAATYQAVPTRIDLALERAGAHRLVLRGAADARADFFGDFEGWYAPTCAEIDRHFEVSATGTASGPLYEVKRLEQPTPEFAQSLAFSRATVTENRELVDLRSPLGRSKKHLTLALPAGMTYRTGDYLSVIAPNPGELVTRAAQRFGLPLEAVLELRATNHDAALPVGVPVSVQALLSSHVELSQPATRKQVELLVARTRCPPEKARVQALADEQAYRTQVLEKRVSLLDLLEMCPAAELTFAEFLELLPPSKPRLYSISSSPLVDPAVATLTVSVVEGPAWSGQGTYRGVASSWLASRKPGDEVMVATKSPNLPFRLPESPEQPLVLVAAGTGLAPFRGFLQERAARRERGQQLGPALLFFGCDHPEVDFLYREELEAWQASGIVSLRPAFFKQPDGEVCFVQHRVWKDRADVQAAIDAGATIYVCGDGAKMAPAVREVVGRILAGDDASKSPAALAAKFEADGRLVADVFS